MDQDEEEEDFGEEDEEEEEEEEDIFTRDKKKIFGDTSHYCPVMLKDKSVLWPGIAECAAKYRERTYFFSSTEARATFLANPTSYLPIDQPLEVSSGFCWLIVFALKKGQHSFSPFCGLFTRWTLLKEQTYFFSSSSFCLSLTHAAPQATIHFQLRVYSV